MHTPLDAHLHTEECNKIINDLMLCHAETSKLSQLFGACNELDMQMRRCTKKERLELTKKNHEASVARYERIHQRMKEIKEGKRAGVFDELLREQEKKK